MNSRKLWKGEISNAKEEEGVVWPVMQPHLRAQSIISSQNTWSLTLMRLMRRSWRNRIKLMKMTIRILTSWTLGTLNWLRMQWRLSLEDTNSKKDPVQLPVLRKIKSKEIVVKEVLTKKIMMVNLLLDSNQLLPKNKKFRKHHRILLKRNLLLVLTR